MTSRTGKLRVAWVSWFGGALLLGMGPAGASECERVKMEIGGEFQVSGFKFQGWEF